MYLAVNDTRFLTIDATEPLTASRLPISVITAVASHGGIEVLTGAVAGAVAEAVAGAVAEAVVGAVVGAAVGAAVEAVVGAVAEAAAEAVVGAVAGAVAEAAAEAAAEAVVGAVAEAVAEAVVGAVAEAATEAVVGAAVGAVVGAAVEAASCSRDRRTARTASTTTLPNLEANSGAATMAMTVCLAAWLTSLLQCWMALCLSTRAAMIPCSHISLAFSVICVGSGTSAISNLMSLPRAFECS